MSIDTTYHLRIPFASNNSEGLLELFHFVSNNSEGLQWLGEKTPEQVVRIWEYFLLIETKLISCMLCCAVMQMCCYANMLVFVQTLHVIYVRLLGIQFTKLAFHMLLRIWGLSLERDEDEKAEFKAKIKELPQLLFVHQFTEKDILAYNLSKLYSFVLGAAEWAFPAAPPNAAGLPPDAMASLKQAQAFTGSPLIQARNFAVMTGVNAGISCVMKRIRGVEDLESSMAAAFGSGAMFSLVSGMGGPNQAVNAVTSGLFFALVQGGLFKFGQKFSQQPAEDIYYSRSKNMLTRLGLQKYEKNFRKGLLTDSTLPLLTDSALRDVKIPPGPRLIILDHIQRDPELKKAKQAKH
ncbi:uncharacterized protein LOC109823562 [Asparagus officinalis]|uniref:uncharacterized protein LOC109823562 n=1 Tax=Asparagus officinalis TaxID=4686 RepID=UPI00098E71D6|nr:uncharacterized protein LOC109823562 [Asparagus officinalis]